jgi:hypothetical protein
MFSWWQGGDICPPIEHFLASSYHEDAKKCSIIFLFFGACHIKKNSFVILHLNIELQNLQTFAPKKNSLCGRPFGGGC